MQSYLQQQAAVDDAARARQRANQATQLRACQRHYADAMERLTATPIDPSGDAVTVRTDLLKFVVKRMKSCQRKIDELQS